MFDVNLLLIYCKRTKDDTMSKKIFKEKQGFRNTEVIVLISILMLGITYKFIQVLILSGAEFNTIQVTCLVLIISLGVFLRFLLKMKLSLSVSEKNLKFKMTPIHSGKQKVCWDDVQSCEIIETPLTAQWLGGNINFNHEKRYTFCGRNGVRLTTKDGQEYFIGSRRLGELKKAIEKAFSRREDFIKTKN